MRSDQITTRIFEVLELIFPPDFLEKKLSGEDPLDPLAATAMAVGQTTINNQLIVAVATATETMRMNAATLTTKTRRRL